MNHRHQILQCVLAVALIAIVHSPPGLLAANAESSDEKVKVVAELRGNSTKFDPRQHGFVFSNEQLVDALALFPREEWWVSYKTRALVALFDPAEVCLGDTGTGDVPATTCMPTPTAQRWIDAVVKTMADGASEGLAVASLALFQFLQGEDPALVDEVYRAFLGFRIPPQYPVNTANILTVFEQHYDRYLFRVDAEDVQDLILFAFASQLASEVIAADERTRATSATEMMSSIRKSLNAFPDAGNELFTISIHEYDHGRLTRGHTLLPYKIVELGDELSRIYVYDSNHPGRDDLYVQIRSDDQWEYRPTEDPVYRWGNAFTRNMTITPMSLRGLGDESAFACTFCRRDNPHQYPVSVYVAGKGEFNVTNNAGSSFGIDTLSGEFSSELAKITTSIRGGLGPYVPERAVLPMDDTGLVVHFWNPYEKGFQTSDLMIEFPGMTVAFRDLQLRSGEVLRVSLNDGEAGPFFDVRATNADVIIPSITFAIDEPAAGHRVALRDLRINRSLGLEFGVSRKFDTLLFGRGRPENGVHAFIDSFEMRAVRQDADGEVELALSDIVVNGQQTAFFEFAAWLQVAAESPAQVREEGLPLYTGFGDIEKLLADPYSIKREKARANVTIRRRDSGPQPTAGNGN